LAAIGIFMSPFILHIYSSTFYRRKQSCLGQAER
jgi:hypothetical protein